MHNVAININGQISCGPGNKQLTQPHPSLRISIWDRAYVYGDSLYEVLRSEQGKILHLDAHLRRLQASAKLCKMTLGQSMEHYRKEIERTHQAFLKRQSSAATTPKTEPSSQAGTSALSASWSQKKPAQLPSAYIRIIVSRGAGPLGFGLTQLKTSTLYTILVQPLEPFPIETYRQGVSLGIVKRLRNHPDALCPAMKSGNYLNSVLAYLEAQEQGFDDALLCNSDGQVTEGTSFNIFYVRRGILVTPPLDIGILPGITRARVLSLARECQISVRETRFPKERLLEADEVFLTSTIRIILPVSRIDGKRIGQGQIGPLTELLLQSFQSSPDEPFHAANRPSSHLMSSGDSPSRPSSFLKIRDHHANSSLLPELTRKEQARPAQKRSRQARRSK